MTSNSPGQAGRGFAQTGDGPGPPPVLLAGLGAACISASAVLIKLANTGTATAAFYRCLLALPLLAALAVLEQRRHGARPLRARERPARRFFFALPVVLAGVVLVSGLADHAHGVHSLAGVEYGLGTSVAYAAFLLILRQTSAATPHVAGPLAEVTLGAAAGAAALGLVFGGWQLNIGWHTFGWLLLLALTSQTAGWLLITSSLPRLPAALSSLLLLLQPAASILLAAVVLSERPSPLQLAGAVLVCTGVLAASRAAPRPTSTASRSQWPDRRPLAAGAAAGSPAPEGAARTGTAPARPPRP